MSAPLDALFVHIAFLDEPGIIIAVTAVWTRFAVENGIGGNRLRTSAGLGLGPALAQGIERRQGCDFPSDSSADPAIASVLVPRETLYQ